MNGLTPLERLILLIEVLERLKPEYALVLWLAYLGGLTLFELATALGISEDAARKRLQRGIAAARTFISAGPNNQTFHR
jgi:RNA polymerase sigma factor (sigma-70 family)